MKLWHLCLSLTAALALPGTALAQVDYSAGKSAPQLFSSDCSACHQSPQGLSKGRDAYTLANFLREHYTTGGASAGLLANYLAGLPAGRQPAPRGSQAPGATATAPTAGAPRPPAGLETERTKPGEARKPKAAATEADREPAKPAVDPLQSKVRSYASTGEEARPVAAAPAQDAAPAISTPSPAAPPAGESSGTAANVRPTPQPESGANAASTTTESAPLAPAAPAQDSVPARPPR